MRRLIVITLVLAVAYAGYWFAGSRAVERGAVEALDGLSQQGWVVAYDDLSTRGFPSRFDTTVTGLTLARPDGVLSYAAPFLQAFALSYRPNRVIVAFPPEQTLTVSGLPVTLTSDRLRASGAVSANTSLTFRSATVEAERLALRSDLGGVSVGPTLAALRAAEGVGAYDAYLSLERIALPDDLWQQMFPQGALPLHIETLTVDAALTLDRDISRVTVTEGPPARIEAVDLRHARLHWGDLKMDLSGRLTAGANGLAEGELTLTTRNWPKLVQGLANIGVIEPGVAPTWLRMGEALMEGGEVLELPITVQGGVMFTGLFPLGPAPRLR